MSVVYLAIPVALLVAAVTIVAFVLQVRSGQYDDLETPAIRILFDEEEQHETALPR
ncbi:MAG: cbb3-type cytochrome oxidase assembly protein CcoS [Planctomycetota bacterium]